MQEDDQNLRILDRKIRWQAFLHLRLRIFPYEVMEKSKSYLILCRNDAVRTRIQSMRRWCEVEDLLRFDKAFSYQSQLYECKSQVSCRALHQFYSIDMTALYVSPFIRHPWTHFEPSKTPPSKVQRTAWEP